MCLIGWMLGSRPATGLCGRYVAATPPDLCDASSDLLPIVCGSCGALAPTHGWQSGDGGLVGVPPVALLCGWDRNAVTEGWAVTDGCAVTTLLMARGGGWFVSQLTGGSAGSPRSACQAGYKAFRSNESGMPSAGTSQTPKKINVPFYHSCPLPAPHFRLPMNFRAP